MLDRRTIKGYTAAQIAEQDICAKNNAACREHEKCGCVHGQETQEDPCLDTEN